MRKYKQIEPRLANTFGSELKRAREARGLTLSEVSSKIGVHYGQLSRFESGVFKVVSANLQRYARYLRVHPPESDYDLSARFRRLAARSPRHMAACTLLLDALEKIG